ncbi:MAG: sugar transferase [Coleofasciculus sp. S288]|nr:sugar transferase [Coleofasciculus sp. S288]
MIVVKNQGVLPISPYLTGIEAVNFQEDCQQFLKDHALPTQIICDFSQTKFIDSSGIGALVKNYKMAREKGVELILRGVRPQVMLALEMAGLSKVLTFDSLAENTATAFDNSENQLPITHPSVRSKLKRVIDIVGGIIGLGITALVFIPIAVAIKLDSPGPIFFSQIRCGWLGRRFRIWKFRSMCVNAEALKERIQNQASGAIFKNDNDPRITRVGRFLRRTSLDELPQFWNVIKGEMSLVGTRPPTPNEVEIYEVPEWQRLNVKPGITGEWQVNGRSQVRDFEDIIRLDLRYQRDWSFLYDLKLILKTVLVLFSKNSGAV